ncbi:MAG: DUF501 domain-containing protein [Actinobacteria bacterium HGW-Actinobacteria-1]|jgi:hypothetical protein|nr:MAG: DUF501 domain-containing protein [Actinobacteria bacterium HGW-Actinobacteria-1]
MSGEAAIVRRQLGREPRGTWRVAVRCSFGYPTVIATPSRLPEGEPFPTLYWLTCPHLLDAVGQLESAGEVDAWAARLAGDVELANRMRAADAAYRVARAAESGGSDACAAVGIAGQRDPLGTKCLHAHVAAALAGINDPIGESILGSLARECEDQRCSEGATDSE